MKKARTMRVAFHSSHPAGDYGGGTLAVDVVREDASTGDRQTARIHFSVPPDYHVHNDSVAAALLTLVGKSCREVTFNFPISQRCAELLRTYYRLDSVGPIDESLEPRRPGRNLAINFSGGVDSTGLYLLLDEVLGDDFKVITYDFGGRFDRERTGYVQFRRDITCRTDLREHGFNQYGRFISSAPLLFADYLDLRAVASGHTLHNEVVSMVSTLNGSPPDYRARDVIYHAGGLEEAHLVRTLCSPGIFRLILRRAPERMRAALSASAVRGTEKYYTRAIWSKHVYRELGIPLPGWIASLNAPATDWQHAGQRFTVFTLWIAIHEGIAEARKVTPEIERYDLSFLDGLSMRFVDKYNTNLASLLPDDIGNAIRGAFHAHGIYPYTERDWQELETVRRVLLEG
jgi:hypothetical protein